MSGPRLLDGDAIRALRRQGLLIAEIARRMGCSQHSVRYHVDGYKQPINDIARPEPRPCLKCERTFRPSHRFNRLCSRCRAENEQLG